MPPEIEGPLAPQENQELEPGSTTLVIFPGQGRSLKEACEEIRALLNHPIGRKKFAQADEIVNGLRPDEFPEGITQLALNGTEEELKRNQQPILFLKDSVSFSIFQQEHPNIKIVGFGGFSFGTVTAAYANGAIKDLPDALRFIFERRDIVREINDRDPGGLELIGLHHSDEKLKELQEESGTKVSIEISNRLTAIGGSTDAIDLAKQKAEEWGIRTIEVPHSDARYHTDGLRNAVPRLAIVLSVIGIKDPHTPLIATSTVKSMNTAQEVETELATHIADTAHWQDAIISTINDHGIEQVVEMNPNGNLINHLQRDLEDQNPTIKRGDLKKNAIKVAIGLTATAAVGIGACMALRALRNRRNRSQKL